MPFHTLRVDIFEGNVKRMVRGATFVTLRQLRYAFKYRSYWQEHLPWSASTEDQIQSTPTIRLICDPYFSFDNETAGKGNEVSYWYSKPTPSIVKAVQQEQEQDKLQEQKICIFKLIALGIILCSGSSKTKAKTLYNIVN